jgi:hypothetical protein
LGGGQDLTPPKHAFIFKTKPLATNTNPEFYPKYKNNVMPISGTLTK